MTFRWFANVNWIVKNAIFFSAYFLCNSLLHDLVLYPICLRMYFVYHLKYVEGKHYDWFICHLIIKSSLLILMCWGFLSLLNILIVSLLQIRHDRNSYGICFGLNEKKGLLVSDYKNIFNSYHDPSRWVIFESHGSVSILTKKLSFTLRRKNK